MCVCESLIQTYINEARLSTFKSNFILKFQFGDLERSRSTGEDLEIVLCGYSVYHEDELTDDKFNVVIPFEISALVYWSDLKNLIGVDLSAATCPSKRGPVNRAHSAHSPSLKGRLGPK